MSAPARRTFGVWTLASLVACVGLSAVSAVAGTCGDDVGGVRIACSCGDVVVSDTRLRSDDPVVASRCSGDGLLVRAATDAPSIKLDLGGQTLTGQGHGAGVRVLRGGASGATIVGGSGAEAGIIANFDTGVRALNPRVLAELRNLRLSGNVRDGAYVRTLDGAIADVTAEQNGRDGLRVGGHGARVERLQSLRNGRYGVLASGRGVELDAHTDANARGDVRARDVR